MFSLQEGVIQKTVTVPVLHAAGETSSGGTAWVLPVLGGKEGPIGKRGDVDAAKEKGWRTRAGVCDFFQTGQASERGHTEKDRQAREGEVGGICGYHSGAVKIMQ